MPGHESRYARSSHGRSAAASIELSCLSRSSSGYDSDVSCRSDSSRFVRERFISRSRSTVVDGDYLASSELDSPSPIRLRQEMPEDDEAGENIKEIFPDIKVRGSDLSYRPAENLDLSQEEKENAGHFLHRAPLLFTRAPPPALKKIVLPAESHGRSKKNKQLKSKCEEICVPDSEKQDETAVSMKNNKAELLKLQCQIEELKLRVRDKEGLLQSIRKSESRVLEQAERSELRSRIQELDKELLRRDFVLHSMQLQLSEKHNEMGSMRMLLQGLQSEIVRRDHRVSQLEKALGELQFVTLRYMNRAAEIGPQQERVSEDEVWVEEAYDQSMEDARTRYLAAVWEAKCKPVVDDESMALLAGLRHQLQDFVSLSQVLPN